MLRAALTLTVLVGGCAAERAVAVPVEPTQPLAPVEVIVTNSVEGAPRELVRQKNFVIDFGDHALEVDPADGGRILGFSLKGRSVIVSRQESPEAYGSSFWPSPQSDWNWPPPAAFDKSAWNAAIDGNVLRLTRATDNKLGLSGEQRIWAEPATGSVVIEHTIVNRGTAVRRVAPWQNTRVRPGGLTFFPSTASPLPDSPLKLPTEAGIVWFKHDPAAFKQGIKGFSDGAEGWLAHVDGDLLLVKVFSDVPRAAQAPKEAEIEIYVDGAGRFVEVEQQGAYAELAAGASSTWPVRWLLRKLPSDVSPEPRNPKLVELARTLAAAK